MTKDLTVGRPAVVILQFILPTFLGLLLQQVYGLVDTIIVGQFLGVDALGGVGSTGALNSMVLGLCNGLCIGFALPVANAFGAKDYPLLRQFVAVSCYLCVFFVGLTMAVVLTFCGQFLQAMHTTAENYPYAYSYLHAIFCGLPFMVLYNMTASIIRALGDSKTPLLFLGIASVLNMTLDLLFVVVMDMGVAGAAWATNLAQGFSGLLCLWFMKRKLPILHFQSGDLQFRWNLAGRLLENGLPTALQFMITSIGSVTLQRAINGLGATCVNAMAIGGKISAPLYAPIDALSAAMATFCGQNTGARQPQRIRQGFRFIYIFAIGYFLLFLSFAVFLSPVVALLFVDRAEIEIIALARQLLIVVGLSSWAAAFVNGFRSSIQGMGYSNLAVFAGILEMIARTLVAQLLVPSLGFLGACLGSTVAWIFADSFLIPTAYGCLRKLNRRVVL